jgi:hypothetical protein
VLDAAGAELVVGGRESRMRHSGTRRSAR